MVVGSRVLSLGGHFNFVITRKDLEDVSFPRIDFESHL